MKNRKHYMTDEELVRVLLDTPWEKGKRESMRSDFKFWLSPGLVTRSA